MKIKIEDLDLHILITGTDILSLIFGDRILEYSYAFADSCPSKLKPALNALRDFEKWVEIAMQTGDLVVSEEGGTFYLHVWGKNNLFLWIQTKKIFRRLEERGVRINNALKKVVEGTQAEASAAPKGKTTKKKIKTQTKTKAKTKAKKETKAPTKKKKYSHGRSDPGGKIQTAIQKLKGVNVAQSLIPYKPEILKLLPNKNASAERQMTPEQYLENTGMKLSTIKTLAREIYNG
jgi:hypothetical protein